MVSNTYDFPKPPSMINDLKVTARVGDGEEKIAISPDFSNVSLDVIGSASIIQAAAYDVLFNSEPTPINIALKLLIMTFLAAGHETTGSCMSFSLYMLAKNSRCQEKLR
ncbi:143_t:CDS:2 [Acaulospora colombiana]|uniref:143_t:CDS:1 n=1 Tax=Acaulospora colombiana TaxID=27376 RepID=A0ACA9K3K4_9GLOM|nr:143_t:CDS:2 [Acaulospora colombiana]